MGWSEANARQKPWTGQASQFGRVGVQTSAPSSMSDWLCVDGSEGSTRACARAHSWRWPEEESMASSRVISRDRTLLTLPSTTAAAIP